MRVSLRSALHDVEHGLSPARLTVPLHVEGANTRLLSLASRLADGGRIAGARAWSLQQWIHRVGFYPQLLPQLEQRGLIRWDGEDLQVLEYVQGHERRIRGLIAVQIPAMMEARGYERADYCSGEQVHPPRDPPRDPPPGSPPLSTRRSYLHPPLTSRLTSQLTPDPGSAPRRARRSDPVRSPAGSGPPLRTIPTSDPPDQPEDRARVSDGSGPEGFERWWAAHPVPKARQPRDPRVWPVWRDRCLAFWAANDLEGEADEILAEVERRKLSTAWVRTPHFIPSGINFLRSGSWRAARAPTRPAAPPARVHAPEVFVPAPWPAAPPGGREELERYMKSLAEGKTLS